MDKMYNVEANKWYHYTITGTNGQDDVNVKVSMHGTDGSYNPEKLSEPVFDGHISATEGRDTILKQIEAYSMIITIENQE